MKYFSKSTLSMALATATLSLSAIAPSLGHAAANEVVIGSIDDMSGLYADVIGQGGIEAMKMAIADFGPTVIGKKIVFLSADHQNKPDVGSSKFREWADQSGINMLLGGSNTGVSIAMSKVAAEKKVPFFAIGAAGASLTNADCTAYTVHYAYDTTALANGTASVITQNGGKSWYFLTADYAFGTQLQDAATKVVVAGGGKSVGAVRVPLAASDFSSFLLQAQGSKAQVLGLANAGNDFTNSLKAANEFGITKTMKVAGLLVFINDVHSLGLANTEGLQLADSWYWNQDDASRTFAKRFFEKYKRMPSSLQAANYSVATTYLKAVQAAGTTDGDKVMSSLKAMKIDDFYNKGQIRADGRMIHDMYLFQVKSPKESTVPWDYYKMVAKIPGDQAFTTVAESKCALLKSKLIPGAAGHSGG